MKQIIKKIPVFNILAQRLNRYIKRIVGNYRLKNINSLRPIRLVVGASGIFDKGWINTDIEYLDLLNRQHWETYFYENSIDAILAEHVWEHLDADQGLLAAQHCFHYLKPGGYLRVAVPDGYHPDEGYINNVKPGGTGSGSDEHKILYNNETFMKIFETAGFRVSLLEYFDNKGKFHTANWDPENGKILRSERFDERNKRHKLAYTSIILDAYKGA